MKKNCITKGKGEVGSSVFNWYFLLIYYSIKHLGLTRTLNVFI